MTFHVRDAGTWKTITDPQVRDGGTWKEVLEGWVKDAGTWKQFFIRMLASVTVNSPWVESFSNAQSPQDKEFTVSIIGGTAPYTYAWSVTSTGGGTLTIPGSTTGATCIVRASGSDANATGDVKCIVTDAALDSAEDTAGINVQFGSPP